MRSMDAEQFRSMVLALPHVEETKQWGDNLVYWVGDKAIGGKMFALVDLDDRDKGRDAGSPVLSLSVGAERYHPLLEREGVVPAPYLARAYWVALECWTAIEPAELRTLLAAAHALTFAKLSRRTQATLALPKAAYRSEVAERRALLRR